MLEPKYFEMEKKMYRLQAEDSFDSAHFLAGYEGKCGNIHADPPCSVRSGAPDFIILFHSTTVEADLPIAIRYKKIRFVQYCAVGRKMCYTYI